MCRLANVLEVLVVCQVGDILISGKTQEQYDLCLATVLDKLNPTNITQNQTKCQFNASSVTYLGHVIDKEGVWPDPERVTTIEDFDKPMDEPGIRRYLGMANFLAKFVPQLATKRKPLRDLLVKENAWKWEPEQEKNFTEIKEIITHVVVFQLSGLRWQTLSAKC